MLLAIISDVHDNLINLHTFLSWSKYHNIRKIICCGDLCNNETMHYLATNFSGDIFLVAGNAETYNKDNIKKYKNITYIESFDYIKLEQITIGLCHESYKIKKLLNIKKDKIDFIFYGHSHKPWLEKKGDTFLVNPGNLADINYPASFAIFNTKNKKIELIILHNL